MNDSTTTHPTLHIDVWSDVLCPFCYIGKRKFEAALAKFEHRDHVRLRWRSFQLDPHYHSDCPVRYADYLQQRKRLSDAQLQQMLGGVTQLAAQVGLQFDFERAIVANSHKAHRLLQWAAEFQLQNALKAALLSAHFEQGLDVGDEAVLCQCAAAVGLDAAAAREALGEARWQEAVQEDIEQAYEIGVRGVPFFVFDGKYAISGAQDEAVFLQTLRDTFGKWQQQHGLDASTPQTSAL